MDGDWHGCEITNWRNAMPELIKTESALGVRSLVSIYKSHVMEKSRKRKLEHFYSLSEWNSSVLDVGVTGYFDYNSQVNLFLSNFRYQSQYYTGLAVEPINQLEKAYPDKNFVQYEGRVFPFPHKSFDWVFSNAVIEHVGDFKSQVLFVNEMVRVSKNVFFTTPNKFFPIESHTNVAFRHWFSKGFYDWCESNHSYYNESNLNLLSYWRLKQILEMSNAEHYKIYCNRTLGLTMTFTVVIHS